MRLMASRAAGILARIVFFLCGVVALVIGALYIMLHGSDLPAENEWWIFAVGLGVVGGISLLAAILPRRWIARICGAASEDSSLRTAPLKMLAVLAAASYLWTLAFYFSPRQWNLDIHLWTYLLSPMYIVRTTIDPPPLVIFILLAPINAAIYGAIGVTMAHGWLALRRRRSVSRIAESH
jgi:hypothetical protein